MERRIVRVVIVLFALAVISAESSFGADSDIELARQAAEAARNSAASAEMAAWVTFGFGALTGLPSILWCLLLAAGVAWDGVLLCRSAFEWVAPYRVTQYRERPSLAKTFVFAAILIAILHLFGVFNVSAAFVRHFDRIATFYVAYLALGLPVMIFMGYLDLKTIWPRSVTAKLEARREAVRRRVLNDLRPSARKAREAGRPIADDALVGDTLESPELARAFAAAWEADEERRRIKEEKLDVWMYVGPYTVCAFTFWPAYLFWRAGGETFTRFGTWVGRQFQKVADSELEKAFDAVDFNTPA